MPTYKQEDLDPKDKEKRPDQAKSGNKGEVTFNGTNELSESQPCPCPGELSECPKGGPS